MLDFTKDFGVGSFYLSSLGLYLFGKFKYLGV